MYHYTSNAMSSFSKEGSYHNSSSTYHPTSQLSQDYGCYTQQPMAVSSEHMLVSPTPPSTATPPSPPSHLNSHANNRPKITTSLWEDECTICYQVDAHGICVARRQDNDMINGTKLLNVTRMSRGKRDGILKNEKGRVVVKVGAMHLKGVWVTFSRAKALAIQHNIKDLLHPLFVDDPSIYFYSNPMAPPHANYFIPTSQPPQQQQQQQQRQQQVYLPQSSSMTSTNGAASSTAMTHSALIPSAEEIYAPYRHAQHSYSSVSTSGIPTPTSSMDHLPPSRAVPSMAHTTSASAAVCATPLPTHQHDYYAYRNPIGSTHYDNNNSSLQDLGSHSIDHLDQHSLLDYASKGSSSMFSLTVSDSSPATPSQQSLFYDSTLTTVSSSATSFPPSPHSYPMDQQQYHTSQRPHQQQYKQQNTSSFNDDIMMNLPVAPTLPSNASLDSTSYYYTHPCVSTVSFQDNSHAIHSSINPSKLPQSSTPCGFSQQQQLQDQATMNFYGSYTPTQYSTAPSATQPW